ncbi:MAG: ThiF family adenylyltransferase [Proteobacteria bacterium]|nr:ThiF family adenylyltransferase [Pseudomonadota bacterium]
MSKDLLKSGIQLRGDALISVENHELSILSHEKLSFKDLDQDEEALVFSLRKGISAESINSAINTDRKKKIVNLLHSNGLLKPFVDSNTLNTRFGRQIDWLSHFSSQPLEMQNNLATRKVLILGCGGTGCIIAEHLLRAGILNFTLVDGAQLDICDLNRQLAYNENDLGQDKSSLLAKKLLSIDSTAHVKAIQSMIENEEWIEKLLISEKPDLLINCADTPTAYIHAWVSGACEKINAPLLLGGVGLKEGSIGPLLLSSESKLKYRDQMLQAAQNLSSSQNIMKASLSFTNSLTSILLAFEAFKFLSGFSEPLKDGDIKNVNFFSIGESLS